MSEFDYIKRAEFERLEERVTTLDIKQTRTEVRTDNIEAKMDKIESNTTWILRLIIGAIALALIGLVLV
ncbi:hemolysin XhlA family protein [Sporosarcina sp. E16_3]|uniref:hemolysin XhlA family protein n=1 Tax=Sporosarcina sp. E16_3 TaxID=2789293 RepID=UPI001C4A1F23|nr:hemolysin XhlA family protein [Sporosarcina sp. E16_3]